MSKKVIANPTDRVLGAALVSMTKKNADLEALLRETQQDLQEAVDRMIENERAAAQAKESLERGLQGICRAIDGKPTDNFDPQWYIAKVGIMRKQLERFKRELAALQPTQNETTPVKEGVA